MNKPTVVVENDYDGYFQNRIEAAIQRNVDNNLPMVDTVVISSGPYRSYDVQWSKAKDNSRASFDFYAAGRVFGHDHSIEELASVLVREGE